MTGTPLRVVFVLSGDRGWTPQQVHAVIARGHEVSVVDSPARSIAGLAELRRTLRRIRPDVLCHDRFELVSAGAPRVRQVVDWRHLESRTARAVERFLARTNTVTICGSRLTAWRHRALGWPVDRTPVVPRGIDTRLFRPLGPADRAAARTRIGVGADDFLVVVAGLVHAVYKGQTAGGHEVVLAAWQQFHAEHPDGHLLLVGGGADEAGSAYRQELIAAFPSVTWVDTVDDVRPYLGAADLAVAPSRVDNHHAVLEAGAMGVPSVVSDAGALPEAVDPAACWIVPAADPDALATALHDAHTEHRAGRLPDRAELVRDRVVRRLDSARSVAAVADLVERAARRRITVFSDAPGTASARYGDRVRLVTGVWPVVPEVVRARMIILHEPGLVGAVAAVTCKLLRRRYSVEVSGTPRMWWILRGAAAVRYGAVLCDEPRRWSPGPFQVVVVGSMERRHGALLRAVRRLVADGLDVRVTLVGGGRRRERLVALAGTLGLAERAHFTGPVIDRDVVTALLDSAHLVALPSRRALVEAMARAVPAVGTCTDLLEPSCLVDPGDDEALARVMSRMLTDPAAWEHQSRRNLERAHRLARVPAARTTS